MNGNGNGKQNVKMKNTVVTDTVELAGEFHEYVRPLMNGGRLTAFCTELTGIQQATVDG